MQEWLASHNIEYPEHAHKLELLHVAFIRLSNPQPRYFVDEIAKASVYEVVRLPPYHCKLNPIELCCSQVNCHIKEHNTKLMPSAV